MTTAKSQLRQELFARRQAIPAARRQHDSARIMTLALEFLQQQQAESVLLYRSIGSEVITTAWHDRGSVPLRVYAPVCEAEGRMTWFNAHESEWQAAGHGLLEPAGGTPWQGGAADWLLCPLLGFNRQGHRIGMGKGYFDRWLAANRTAVRGCLGLAFACQEVAQLPVEAHDEPLDGIITEKGIIRV